MSIKYLSPSSLGKMEKQPYTFLCERILRVAQRDPQSLAAAAGSAFDVYVKTMLMSSNKTLQETVKKRVLKSCFIPEVKAEVENMSLLDMMFHLAVEAHHRDAIRLPGLGLASKYYNSATNKATLWEDFEFHKFYTLIYKGVTVPLFMKLDAVVKCPAGTLKSDTLKRIAPHDWKVSGYTAPDGASLKPGYKSIEYLGYNILKGPHKDYLVNCPMEQIDFSWATQLCTYGWGIGYPVGTPFMSYIDCLALKNEAWQLARYEGMITTAFQEAVAERYVKAWTSLHDGSFVANLCTDPVLAAMFARTESWY